MIGSCKQSITSIKEPQKRQSQNLEFGAPVNIERVKLRHAGFPPLFSVLDPFI